MVFPSEVAAISTLLKTRERAVIVLISHIFMSTFKSSCKHTSQAHQVKEHRHWTSDEVAPNMLQEETKKVRRINIRLIMQSVSEMNKS